MHGMLNAKKSHKIFVVNRPKNAKENLKKHFKTSTESEDRSNDVHCHLVTELKT